MQKFTVVKNLPMRCSTATLSVLSLALFFICNENQIVAVSISEFFPFGSDHGDNQLPNNDDDIFFLFFPSPFPFYGQSYDTLYVSTDGVMFLNVSNVLNLVTTSLPTDKVLIAPYWADVDTSGIGDVFFRSTTSPTLLNNMSEIISTAFTNLIFTPQYLIIATWYEVGYNLGHTDKNNTFQSVLATDGESSFVLFLYEEEGIQWTTGDSDGGEQGLGGTPATVGIDSGDMVNFVSVPGSGTADVINISSTSNVGIPGMWLFQINQTQDQVNTTNDECSDYDIITYFTQDTVGTNDAIFGGDFEICVGGVYGSVCDIGWDDSASQAICDNQLGSGYVGSSVLGFPSEPLRGYVAQNFTCSSLELISCNFSTFIDSECFEGAHIVGIWCTQMNNSGLDIVVLDGFLSFGAGDSVLPIGDDESSQAILLATDVVIFGSHQNKLYVNTNGVLSFGEPYAVSSSGGLNFSSIITPPIIAPFWDDINTNIGGAIYYRQDTNPAIHEQLRQKVSAEYPEVTRFIPSLVFVATWYRVEANDINFSLLHNTFQVVVISDGTLTFICFNYDDLQWGGSNTLIGVSAGDGVNSLTGLGSLSEYVVFNQFSYLTYRIDTSQVSTTTSSANIDTTTSPTSTLTDTRTTAIQNPSSSVILTTLTTGILATRTEVMVDASAGLLPRSIMLSTAPTVVVPTPTTTIVLNSIAAAIGLTSTTAEGFIPTSTLLAQTSAITVALLTQPPSTRTIVAGSTSTVASTSTRIVISTPTSIVMSIATSAVVSTESRSGHVISTPTNTIVLTTNTLTVVLSARSTATFDIIKAFISATSSTTTSNSARLSHTQLATVTVNNGNSTDSLENFFEMNKWAFISVAAFLGLAFLLLLPGALFGYTKVSRTIVAYEKHIL